MIKVNKEENHPIQFVLNDMQGVYSNFENCVNKKLLNLKNENCGDTIDIPISYLKNFFQVNQQKTFEVEIKGMDPGINSQYVEMLPDTIRMDNDENISRMIGFNYLEITSSNKSNISENLKKEIKDIEENFIFDSELRLISETFQVLEKYTIPLRVKIQIIHFFYNIKLNVVYNSFQTYSKNKNQRSHQVNRLIIGNYLDENMLEDYIDKTQDDHFGNCEISPNQQDILEKQPWLDMAIKFCKICKEYICIHHIWINEKEEYLFYYYTKIREKYYIVKNFVEKIPKTGIVQISKQDCLFNHKKLFLEEFMNQVTQNKSFLKLLNLFISRNIFNECTIAFYTGFHCQLIKQMILSHRVSLKNMLFFFKFKNRTTFKIFDKLAQTDPQLVNQNLFNLHKHIYKKNFTNKTDMERNSLDNFKELEISTLFNSKWTNTTKKMQLNRSIYKDIQKNQDSYKKPCKCDKICDKSCMCRINSFECQPNKCPCLCNINPALHHKNIPERICQNTNYWYLYDPVNIVKETPICLGMGLFASKDYSKEDFIGFYGGEYIYGDEEFKRNIKVNFDCSSYIFNPTQKNQQIDALLLGNQTRYINHMKDEFANVSVQIMSSMGREFVAFFAKKDINIGEELFFDYGKEYNMQWKNKFDSVVNHKSSSKKDYDNSRKLLHMQNKEKLKLSTSMITFNDL